MLRCMALFSYSAYRLFVSFLSFSVSTGYPNCCYKNYLEVAPSMLISHSGQLLLLLWFCYILISWDSFSPWCEILSHFNIARSRDTRSYHTPRQQLSICATKFTTVRAICQTPAEQAEQKVLKICLNLSPGQLTWSLLYALNPDTLFFMLNVIILCNSWVYWAVYNNICWILVKFEAETEQGCPVKSVLRRNRRGWCYREIHVRDTFPILIQI